MVSEGPTATAAKLLRRDRILKKIAYWAIWALYRSVDVYYAAGSRTEGPQLAVANHFGGFSDPLLLLYAMERRPRVMAKDVIWKIPIAKQLMNWMGAIPVHQPKDRGSPTSNDEMFASAYEALGQGDQLTIFPEGVTVDDPSIARVKTGAARIVLGARAQGVRGINIVPAGIHYEDKAALRSRAFINFGPALDLDAHITDFVTEGETEGPSNRQAVRSLTADIERRLRSVAPDFEDWREAHSLGLAAEVAIRAGSDIPSELVAYGERERLAALLGRRSTDQKEPVVEAAEAYRQDLEAVGLSDQQVVNRITTGGFLWYVVRSILLGLLLLPFALVGVLMYWLPALLVWLIGKLRVAAAVLATLKPMAAILGFGIAVGAMAWGAFRTFGIGGAAAVLLLAPIYLLAVITLSERVALLWRAWRTWRHPTSRRGVFDAVVAARQRVIEAVHEAI